MSPAATEQRAAATGRGLAGAEVPAAGFSRSFSAPRPGALGAPLTVLSGVGPKLAEAAASAGIATVGDLLARIPHSYRDRSEPRLLAELRVGEEATVRVEVRRCRLRRPRRRGLTIVEAEVADESGSARAIWFNQPWLAERLRPGAGLLVFGSMERRGLRVSEHEFLSATGEGDGLHTIGLVPVHPASERLRAQRIREWVAQALAWASDAVEPLPAELRARRRLPAIADALCAVHFPGSLPEAAVARDRLAFEELLLHQAALVSRRRRRRAGGAGPPIPLPGPPIGGWLGSLPFDLTADQRRAIEEIDADLCSGEPMQRLLMGEVGSGKTVVALYAMLRGVEAGHQAALMAPTETLAEQHAATLERLIAGSSYRFALITGSTATAERRRVLEHLASGEVTMVVGTHALLEPGVRFARLGVCVIDEQHRFGVAQRSRLDAKAGAAATPHALHMTATPIPRTLSLTAFGDLDTSALHELPAGRRPVETRLVDDADRDGAYAFLRDRLREGRQAYVVCPLVEESEKLSARAAEEEARRLAAGELAGFRVGLLHGRIPAARKGEVMRSFAAGELDVLVATTVIEVGVDVPNATVIVVESAERYGVSQLHQLRGRVGRGAHSSHCLLFAGEAGEIARRRLEAVADERDGFRLAELDLALRGQGEILGTRQHGLPRFRFASLPEDMPMLLEARGEVLELERRHGSLGAAALGPLLDEANARFGPGRADPIPA